MKWQARFLLILLVGGFLVLSVRLVDLVIIRGGYYRQIAQNNRIRRIPLYAPRGQVVDRNGEVLADNAEVSQIIRFEQGKAAAVVETGQFDPAGDVRAVQYRRVYPHGAATAHLVGFVGETNREEIGQIGCLDNGVGAVFNLGATVGRMGAERSFDCLLRGRDGEELVEVDAQGRKVRLLGRVEPRPGMTIKLSIDSRLQERASRALAGRPGAVVALDPASGEILALVSGPSFDPNDLATYYSQITANSQLPFFNRAIGGTYPPGSTFKIVVAAAGLEDGKIDESFRFTDPGVVKVGTFSYANWYFSQYGRTEGEIDIVRAITRSTDTFFYHLGELVGVDRLVQWAHKFGLGQLAGIDLAGEAVGIIPTPDWKERVRGERWFLGNTYHLAIGQGDIAATPLQVARMTGVIASGGKLCQPTVKKIENLPGEKRENCHGVEISQKTLELIRKGMVGACSPGGTAFPLFNFTVIDPHAPASASARQIQLACKTGTAEFGDAQKRTHAWLTAFAPASAVLSEVEGQKIVVTALVEAGGEGSRVAAPIVREVLQEWFEK